MPVRYIAKVYAVLIQNIEYLKNDKKSLRNEAFNSSPSKTT